MLIFFASVFFFFCRIDFLNWPSDNMLGFAIMNIVKAKPGSNKELNYNSIKYYEKLFFSIRSEFHLIVESC